MITRSAIVDAFVRPRTLGAATASVLALLSVGLLDLIVGQSLGTTYRTLWDGSLANRTSLGITITSSLPYALTGIAFAVGFRAGAFNLGLEGQLLWGALAAAIVGSQVNAPGVLLITCALIAAMVAGGLWALLPAVLRVLRGVNEIVSSLFLNYVTSFLVAWLIAGPLRAPGALSASTAQIRTQAQLPVLFSGTTITIGILIVISVAFLFWLGMTRTPAGYEIQTVGSNPAAAEYAGISTSRVFIRSFVISGALGGLAGAIEVLGNQHAVAAGFSSNWGYFGIAVALIGGTSGLGCLAAALLFGILSAGGQQIQLVLGVDADFIQAAQAIALVCFIGGVAGTAQIRAALAAAHRRAVAISAPTPEEQR